MLVTFNTSFLELRLGHCAVGNTRPIGDIPMRPRCALCLVVLTCHSHGAPPAFMSSPAPVAPYPDLRLP